MSYKHLAEALLLGKPYFGDALRAKQGLIERHQYFRPVISIFDRSVPLNILEIGSWAGASAISWALALRDTRHPGRITCVDPWEPYFSEVDQQDSSHYR